MSTLQEDYVFPIHLKHVDTLVGVNLYTSETIKKKFVEIMSKIIGDPELSKKISDLVSQDKLVPCFTTSGMFRTIIKMIKRREGGVAGIYYADKDKTFVIVDMAHYRIFSPSNSELERITIHELVHMSFRKNWKELFPLFIDNVVKFFTVFYKCYFEVDVKKSRMKKFVEGNITESYVDYKRKVVSILNGMDPKKVDQYFSLTDEAVQLRNHEPLYKKYPHITHCLLYAYGESFDLAEGLDIPLSFQELWHPDEIICIVSDFLYKTDSRFKKAILMI